MKKIITSICMMLCILAASIAQPTLTHSGTALDIGSTFDTHTGTYVAPGNSGASVTWDFSTFTAGTDGTSSVVNPSSTPYAADFPTAVICLVESDIYQYLEDDGSVFSQLGAKDANFSTIFSDPQELFHFPIDFQDSFSDSYEGVIVTTQAYTRTGTVDVTADAYGTLITPSATFTDVMRINVYSDFTDDYGGGVSYNGTFDYYWWFKEGIHYPLFLTNEQTYAGFPAGSYAYFTDGGSSAVEDVETTEIELNVFPNPASDLIQIEFKEENISECVFEVCDVTGRIVLNGQLTSSNPAINIESLDAGTYILRLTTDEKVMTEKILVN